MSVNGLDTAEITEALQKVSVNSDTGGWFVLHYITRDDLGVLCSGTNGVHEITAAMTAYSEKSPLYGFIHYQQRKLLLKYIPQGTSRLLQARTAVHLQSVIDCLPSDTAVIECTTLDDVTKKSIRDALQLDNEQETINTPVLESDIPVASSNPEVAAILSRLKAIKAKNSGTYSLNAFDDDPARDQGVNDQVSHRSKELPRLSRGNSVSQFSSTSAEFKEDIDRAQRSASIDHWRTSKDTYDYDYSLPKLKEKAFPRPVADSKTRVSQDAARQRQRLPSGVRIGSQSARVSDERVRQIKSTKGSKGPQQSVTISASWGASPHLSSIVPQQATTSQATLLAPRKDPHLSIITQSDTSRRDWGNTYANPRAFVNHEQYTNWQTPFKSSTERPLSYERQRLMKALSMRRERMDTSTNNVPGRTSIGSDKQNTAPLVGKLSNADSGVDLHYGEYTGQQVRHLNGDSQRSLNTIFNTGTVTHSPTRQKSTPSQYGAQEIAAGGSLEAIRNEEQFSPRSTSHKSPNEHIPVDGLVDEDEHTDSSSSASLLEELQDAVVEEAREISLPLSPKIMTGLDKDGTPSPYSVTSVVIRTGSTHSCSTSAANSPRAGHTFSAFSATTSILRDGTASKSRSHWSPQIPQALELSNGKTSVGTFGYLPSTTSARTSSMFLSNHQPSNNGINSINRRSNGLQSRGANSMHQSSNSIDHDGKVHETKRHSLTTRMLKRLSSGFSTSSRQPLVGYERSPSINTTSEIIKTTQQSHAAYPAAIGELNVQFPDTLLWRRRWVEVDTSGNLVLSATKVTERMNSPPKRYHLAEFKMPTVPSHDRQEMPCSILLDFVHGGTLQLACDDFASQAQVLEWISNVYRRVSR